MTQKEWKPELSACVTKRRRDSTISVPSPSKEKFGCCMPNFMPRPSFCRSDQSQLGTWLVKKQTPAWNFSSFLWKARETAASIQTRHGTVLSKQRAGARRKLRSLGFLRGFHLLVQVILLTYLTHSRPSLAGATSLAGNPCSTVNETPPAFKAIMLAGFATSSELSIVL